MLLNIKETSRRCHSLDEKADISQAYTKSKLFINCKILHCFLNGDYFRYHCVSIRIIGNYLQQIN